jgi:DNA (cytosine-5)-methyltransferase 1
VTLRGGCLFAGAGALELAVGSVLDVDPVWFVENDPAASRVLAHHWPGVPNYGDITTVDWDSVEPIDLLTGGFPCTDVSAAGKRAGLRPGTRSGLWSHMAYAINKLRPKLVVIENVRGLLSTDAHCDLEPCPWCLGDNEGRPMRALGAVLSDLASIGYDARWCGLRASDVGAPHGRFRVFILAWPAADGAGVGLGEGWPESAGIVGGSDVAVGGDGVIADPATSGWGQPNDVRDDCRPAAQPSGQTEPGRRGRVAADSERLRRETGWSAGPRETPGRWTRSDVAGRDGFAATADAYRSGRRPGSGVGRPDGQAVAGDGAPSVSDPDRSGGEGRGTAGLEGETGPAVGLLTGPEASHTCLGPELSGPVVPDGAGGVEPDEQGSGTAGGQQVGAVAGAGDRVSSGDQAEGVHGNGRPAPILEWGEYEPAIRRWERIIGRPATAPTVTGQRGGQQLSPVFTEWMMGWPDGWVTAVPGITRSDQIKLCGNGVVTQQAAWAARYLMAAIAGM